MAARPEPGQSAMTAKGGKGGFGNAYFKSSVNRAPRRANPGQDGEEMTIILRLKLIADAGLRAINFEIRTATSCPIGLIYPPAKTAKGRLAGSLSTSSPLSDDPSSSSSQQGPSSTGPPIRAFYRETESGHLWRRLASLRSRPMA